MSYCETCKYRNEDGWCGHPKLRQERYGNIEMEDDELVYPNNYEGGWFWVGPKFGCMHHTMAPETNDNE